MDAREWAKNEIELAIKNEHQPNATEKEIQFGTGCFEAALHAYETMVEDVNAGKGALGLNAQILIQLVNKLPLTPIDDISDNWEEIASDEHGILYRCKRLDSLNKLVKPDKTVKFTDTNRYYCVDINDPESPFTGGLAGRVLDDILPIQFPYQPVGKIRIFLEQFSAYPDKKEPDTFGVLYFRFPDGQMQNANRYFKSDPKTEEWEEIRMTEYGSRRKKWQARVQREEKKHKVTSPIHLVEGK